MAELKTKKTDASVEDFINTVDNETKRADAFELLKLFKKVTGKEPKMWGTSIIGFGQYHYKSLNSSQQGDWPLVGFSPRKANLTLYVMPGLGAITEELKKLGKHKLGGGCLYINKLADVDPGILEVLIEKSFKAVKENYSLSLKGRAEITIQE